MRHLARCESVFGYIRPSRFARTVRRKAHIREVYIAVLPNIRPFMAMKKCPVCGASVKVENLERHVKNQHPRANVDMENLLTADEHRTVRETKSVSRPTLTRSGRRTIAIVAVILAGILIVAVLATQLKPPGTGVGKEAPDFTLTTSLQTTVTLSSYRGTPVFLEFMNTLCHFCVNEAPVLASLHDAYSSRVHFLSIDIAVPGLYAVNNALEVNAYRTTYGTFWDYAIDTNDVVRTAYGVTGTPTMFVLDATGVIVTVIPGYTTYSALAAAFNQTLV